jgi:hypothetical protein
MQNQNKCILKTNVSQLQISSLFTNLRLWKYWNESVWLFSTEVQEFFINDYKEYLKCHIKLHLYLFSDRFGGDDNVDRSKYNNFNTRFTVFIIVDYKITWAFSNEVNEFVRWHFIEQKLQWSQSQPPVHQSWLQSPYKTQMISLCFTIHHALVWSAVVGVVRMTYWAANLQSQKLSPSRYLIIIIIIIIIINYSHSVDPNSVTKTMDMEIVKKK